MLASTVLPPILTPLCASIHRATPYMLASVVLPPILTPLCTSIHRATPLCTSIHCATPYTNPCVLASIVLLSGYWENIVLLWRTYLVYSPLSGQHWERWVPYITFTLRASLNGHNFSSVGPIMLTLFMKA